MDLLIFFKTLVAEMASALVRLKDCFARMFIFSDREMFWEMMHIFENVDG